MVLHKIKKKNNNFRKYGTISISVKRNTNLIYCIYNELKNFEVQCTSETFHGINYSIK